MKKYTTLFLALLCTSVTMAQSLGELRVKLVDQSDKSEIVGATLSLTNGESRTIYQSSNQNGSCSFTQLPYGSYLLQATYIGYDTIRTGINLNQKLMDLGTLEMAFKAQEIAEVSVMGNAIRTSLSGDTVIYNADAYKVTSDAVVEGLLAKMPGIKVDDGEVEAQGEEVKRVYLDGKEFFGEDVALAVKNIPADIIAKVEVFNKLSDNAEFTGFDDGESYKALNFVTREGKNRGEFGKFVAGYALDNLYQLNASYNYFTGNHRITVTGMANNMNIKGFGSMDLVGGGGTRVGGGGRSMGGGGGSFVGSPSGISTLGAVGVNYGGSFAEDKFKVEASYFYNLSLNEVDKETDRQYLTTDDELQRFYNATNNSESSNYNHRINSRLEYKPNERNSFMMRPEVAFQDNGSAQYALATNSEAATDGTLSELSQTESSTTSDKVAYTLSNTLVYRTLLDENGRNIMVSAKGNYSNNNSDALSTTNIEYPTTDDTFIKLNTLNGTKNYNIGSSVTYSEPIMDKKAMLTMKYNINHRYSDADYLVYEWEQQENLFNPDYDPTSSNIYNSGYTTHEVGPGIMYSVPQSLQMSANVAYQYSALANDQELPIITPSNQRYTFDNVVYSLNMRKSFNSTSTLRLMLRSNTENPSISALQDVVKDSNPQNVTSGNSDLKPSYNNSFKATYNLANITQGQTFMAMLSANLTNNYIGESKIMLLSPDDSYTLPNGEELERYGQYTTPVNLDGNWRITSSISYGTPINLISSNLNVDLGASYGESPSIFNGINNMSTTTSYKAGASVGSNISQNADFTLSYNGGYNIADYKYNIEGSQSQRNEYMTHRATAQYKFIFWDLITLYGNTSYTQYQGITDDFKEEYVMCNLYLGMKLFKNQSGEISIGVNDLFNQSENFARNTTDSYIENVTSNTIGRYYGIKFTYDLRRFNGSQTGNTRGEHRPNMGDGGMGGGRGPR